MAAGLILLSTGANTRNVDYMILNNYEMNCNTSSNVFYVVLKHENNKVINLRHILKSKALFWSFYVHTGERGSWRHCSVYLPSAFALPGSWVDYFVLVVVYVLMILF